MSPLRAPDTIARTFLARGTPVLQGYGLTESSPVVAANRPEDHDPRSVGPPLSGAEVHIGEEKRRVSIRGRVKDILVTSIGEKIAPADLESAIRADPVFDQARVIGESRPPTSPH